MKWIIGVITHYKEMERFRRLEQHGLEDCKLHFGRGVMEHAIKLAKQMEEELHCHAIIASPGTAKCIEAHVQIPVLPLHIRNDNICEALAQAKTMGKKIAFSDLNKNVIYDVEHVSRMMETPLYVYDHQTINQTEEVVTAAVADGMDVIITPASCMEAAAKLHHLPAVLIRLQEQDIIDAARMAVNILKIRAQSEEQIRWLTAATENLPEGVLLLDHQGRVMLANSLAASVLRTSPAELVGRCLAELCEQYELVKELVEREPDCEFRVVTWYHTQYMITQQEIKSASGILGSIIRISEVKQIQRTEMVLRKTMGTSGFIAKYTFDDIIGNSDAICQAKGDAMCFAQSDAAVLILGESGCGKELLAQSIHNASPFASNPFVAINCTALPENLLESELFGYEDGAFTGSKRGGKAGLFEMAHGGTLFLDEIGDMPLQLQAKLLRALQEKVIRRIGGEKNIPVQVRLICATNKDLSLKVQENEFREDLFYRINVLRLRLPPLRERSEDIPALVSHFIRSSDLSKFDYISISPQHFSRMEQWPWPGNIRELQNFIQRFTAMYGYGDSGKLLDYLLDELESQGDRRAAAAPSAPSENTIVVPIGTSRDIERFVIQELLRRYNGRQQEVERILGISSTTMWRRLKEQAEHPKAPPPLVPI